MKSTLFLLRNKAFNDNSRYSGGNEIRRRKKKK